MTFNEINNQADIGDGFMLYANSGIIIKPEENAEAVSYTHLDVYKRQVKSDIII